MPKIREVFELLTDGGEDGDKINEHFAVTVGYDDGTTGELQFTLAGGRMLRDLFDAVPELDDSNFPIPM